MEIGDGEMVENSKPGIRETFVCGYEMLIRTAKEAHLYFFSWIISMVINFVIPIWADFPNVTNKDMLIISFVVFINMFLFTAITTCKNSANDKNADAIDIFTKYICVISLLLFVIYLLLNNELSGLKVFSWESFWLSFFLIVLALIHYLYQTYTTQVIDRVEQKPILDNLDHTISLGGRKA